MRSEQPLEEYLAQHQNRLTISGVRLCAITVRPRLSVRFQILGVRPEFMTIRAVGAEDWCFAPSHHALEGGSPIELVQDDPKLTREYLKSLDFEGLREEFPERTQMLRHGDNWVIAAEFWVEVDEAALDHHDR